MIKDPEIDRLNSSLGIGICTALSISDIPLISYGYVVPELVPLLMDDVFHQMDLRSLSESVRACT